MGIIKKIATSLYSVRMKFSSLTKLGMTIKSNTDNTAPLVSFHSLHGFSNNGEETSLKKFHGKKIIIVNLASECGYTPQYNELEELYRSHKENLVILGFPSNQFGGQEPGTDDEIANFCKVNFGVTFPLFQKSEVKGSGKNEIYQWLSDPTLNGWNDEEPSWNFCKYLVDEDGYLTHFFSAGVSPISEEIINAISGNKNTGV